MYIKKRIIPLCFTFLFMFVLLAGCSNGGKDNTVDPTPTTAPADEPDPTEAPAATPTPEPAPTPEPVDYTTAVIKDIYADDFSIGAVLGASGLNMPALTDLVKTHFNSLTLENEMKPSGLLDYNASITEPIDNESPSINFTTAERGLKFAKENGIKMRGHTLVWHSQTPRWLFTEGYSIKRDAPFVSREVMLKRMENYIKQVLEYTQTNYPGVIYAWDVVNEAIQVSDGHPDGLRTESSLWYQVVGVDYIEKAFEYAKKYADPEVKLFYNDYNTEDSAKAVAIKNLAAKLVEQGTIDGIGMQTHIKLDSPSLGAIDESTRSYAELGLEIQVTELDVDMETNTEEDLAKQATRYRRLFLYFIKWKQDGIKLTNVTFWGTTDDRSWLNKPNEPSYPLLFDASIEKKPAYFGAIQDPAIPVY